MGIISSVQNATVKDLVKLRENSRYRRSENKFTVEGAREISRAIASRFQCDSFFYCTSILSEEAKILLGQHSSVPKVEVSEAVFQKIVLREGTDGIFALFRSKSHCLDTFVPGKHSIILVFDQIEKPGNFGALLRTADGVGVDAIFVLDKNADIYNPNAIRSSVGAVFSRPIFTCEHMEFATFCKDRNFKIVTASPFAKNNYFEEDLQGPLALVLGSEAKGLSQFWDTWESVPVKIPMNGLADSLNVSVAGAVILYEALRQRQMGRI